MTGHEPDELAELDLLIAAATRGADAPRADLRARVLAFAQAPQGPIDAGAYDWTEIQPGVRAHVVHEGDGVRKVLIWAKPGAIYPPHRHLGEEEILVLQGGLRDHRGEYRPGDILRSATGSVHSEEALPGEDCFCFVVYRGEHEFVS